MDDTLKYQVASLRSIAERVNIPHLRGAIRQPGVKALYRITAYYADFNLCHSVATIYDCIQTPPRLEITYEGMFENRPIHHPIDAKNLAVFTQTLQRVSFDKLVNQPDIPTHESSLWMIEKAMGGFYKALILSPDKPEMPYSLIANVIDDYLPAAIRRVGVSA